MGRKIPFVVFTGAGASRAEPISLPTTTEFFQQIMDEQHNPQVQRIGDKRYFKFIFDTLYDKDTNYDLERIMGALYGLSDFTDNDCWRIFQNPIIYDNIISSLSSKYNGIRMNSGSVVSLHDCKNLIQSATEQTYNKYKNDAKKLIFDLEWLIRERYESIPNNNIRKVYEPFFEILFNKLLNLKDTKKMILPFFTTNYDMSIDWFFEPWDQNSTEIHNNWLNEKSYKITYIDGFTKRGWSSDEYNTIVENQDVIYVPYYKLHGSLFWEEVNDVVRMGANVASDPINPDKLMIVYPSDKKVLLEDPYYYNQKQLEEYLKDTDKLIVIGFSFRDPEIVRLFENALNNNENMKVIVISPDYNPKYCHDMDRFLKHNQVVYIKACFGTNEVLQKLEGLL